MLLSIPLIKGVNGASPKPRETVMLDLVLKSDEMTSAELDRVAGGTVDANELGMIRIQSLASQRQTALQTAADILHSSSDTVKGIINHIH